MGSFAGHIDEAIFFLLIAVWWMLRSFPAHIRSSWSGREFTCRLSYAVTIKGLNNVPVESLLKILFPLAGFIAEVLSGGGRFLDDEGNFRKVNQMLHMTIYGMFIIHAVIDTIGHLGIHIFPGLDYLSGAVCFTWYGIAFDYHAKMHGKEGMERMVHLLPINIMFLVAVSMVIEAWHKKCFMAHVARIYGVLVLGTYFVHISFVFYSPAPFPGNRPNPSWNHDDMRNANALVSVMGLHLCLHLVTIPVVYLSSKCLMQVRGQHLKQFVPLLDTSQTGLHAVKNYVGSEEEDL